MTQMDLSNSVSDVILRKAKKDDCDIIASFIRLMLKELSDMGGHPENQENSFWKSFADTISSCIDLPDRLYLIAENNGVPIGFFEGRVDLLYMVFKPKKSFRINSVYVIPEKRNHGIGARFISAGLYWATEKECVETSLTTLRDNSKAQSLYKKFGFSIFQYEMRMRIPTNAKTDQ